MILYIRIICKLCDKLHTGCRQKQKKMVNITVVCNINPNNFQTYKEIEWRDGLNVRGSGSKF